MLLLLIAPLNSRLAWSAYRGLVVLVETSSRRRQASSSWARVFGGGSGGMAGSWIKGWAGWWPRRWPQLPPPPHVCVWAAAEPPKDFLAFWLLQQDEEARVRQRVLRRATE